MAGPIEMPSTFPSGKRKTWTSLEQGINNPTTGIDEQECTARTKHAYPLEK